MHIEEWLALLGTLDWRVVLLTLVALLALYLGISLLRMGHLLWARRRKHKADTHLDRELNNTRVQSALNAYSLGSTDEPSLSADSATEDLATPTQTPIRPQRSRQDFAWNEPPEPRDGSALADTERQRIDSLERNIAQLRNTLSAEIERQFDQLGSELGAQLADKLTRELSAKLDAMLAPSTRNKEGKTRLNEANEENNLNDVGSAQIPKPNNAKAQTPRVSHYSDAMQMAREGHDAASIAAHWNIARAEAELVIALARGKQQSAPSSASAQQSAPRTRS
ncbi:MAG: DUF2802 domain-containing protein [Pseudomonadota bacterium]